MNITKKEEVLVKHLYKYMGRIGIKNEEQKFFICAFVINGIQHVAETPEYYKRCAREELKRIEQAEAQNDC